MRTFTKDAGRANHSQLLTYLGVGSGSEYGEHVTLNATKYQTVEQLITFIIILAVILFSTKS